jgi:general secretion pathway protein C
MRIHKLFMLLDLVLAGIIVWLGVGIFRTWASARTGNAESAGGITMKSIADPSHDKKMEHRQYFQSIIQSDIFQTKKMLTKPTLKKAMPPLLKATDLNLELKGTMTGETGERLAVILDGKTREQEIYHVNDFVHGARIDKILSDEVILNRNGNEESLQMSYESGPAQLHNVPEKGQPRRSTVRTPPSKKAIPKRILPGTRKLPGRDESGDIS